MPLKVKYFRETARARERRSCSMTVSVGEIAVKVTVDWIETTHVASPTDRGVHARATRDNGGCEVKKRLRVRAPGIPESSLTSVLTRPAAA